MQRTSFENLACPIARSLERVGEWWSILILRDAFYGLTKFDEFQKSLKIAPNMLTRRLTGLVKAGLMERRQYCDKPPRYEYVLTECGRDFRPVLFALLTWGNKHFAPEGESVVVLEAKTGRRVDLELADAASGKTLSEGNFVIGAGPAADEEILERIELATQRHRAKAKPPSET